MNEIPEMWSLPWHALQRNLALGLGGNAAGHSHSGAKIFSVQGIAMPPSSWLSRVRRQEALPPRMPR